MNFQELVDRWAAARGIEPEQYYCFVADKRLHIFTINAEIAHQLAWKQLEQMPIELAELSPDIYYLTNLRNQPQFRYKKYWSMSEQLKIYRLKLNLAWGRQTP